MVSKMTQSNPILMLEFNELTPDLMDSFIGEKKLPNFARLRSQAHTFVTDAEEEGERLNPWVQWVTAHTGHSADEHGIIHLDDGAKLKSKNVWELINDAKKGVWVCGSMNIRPYDGVIGGLLPDPWSTSVDPYPNELSAFHRFVGYYVQEHTRDKVGMGIGDYASFLGFMTMHGLSFSTVSAAIRQLLRELGGRYRWKRVEILDRLQWDLFYWYYRKFRPEFSTFFLNSTAHLQHKFWRNMDPGPFDTKPSDREQEECEGAILFGYQSMDRLLGRILDCVGDDATIVFCTGLSQQPCTVFEELGGKRFYRPASFDELSEFAGVDEPCEMSPVMSEEFHARFENEADASSALAKYARLSVDGSPLLRIQQQGQELFLGCCIYSQVAADAKIQIDGVEASVDFFRLFYQADSVKSGMHHPDGMLWIRTAERRHVAHQGKVPLRAVAPTVLNLLRIPVPSSMSASPLLDA